jgi:hypothetical protein
MYFPRSQAPAFVQLHSQDYLIRVADEMLRTIVFDHVCTVQDLATFTGYTEWQANWHGKALSLGWDWMESMDGGIRRADTIAPRSNLRLVDAQGYDLSPDDELPSVYARIDSLLWQSTVLEAIRIASIASRKKQLST